MLLANMVTGAWCLLALVLGFASFAVALVVRALGAPAVAGVVIATVSASLVSASRAAPWACGASIARSRPADGHDAANVAGLPRRWRYDARCPRTEALRSSCRSGCSCFSSRSAGLRESRTNAPELSSAGLSQTGGANPRACATREAGRSHALGGSGGDRRRAAPSSADQSTTPIRPCHAMSKHRLSARDACPATTAPTA